MYVDEDGDTAHEFYVEVTDGSKATLKQINNKNLTPQVSFAIKTKSGTCLIVYERFLNSLKCDLFVLFRIA